MDADVTQAMSRVKLHDVLPKSVFDMGKEALNRQSGEARHPREDVRYPEGFEKSKSDLRFMKTHVVKDQNHFFTPLTIVVSKLPDQHLEEVDVGDTGVGASE